MATTTTQDMAKTAIVMKMESSELEEEDCMITQIEICPQTRQRASVSVADQYATHSGVAADRLAIMKPEQENNALLNEQSGDAWSIMMAYDDDEDDDDVDNNALLDEQSGDGWSTMMAYDDNDDYSDNGQPIWNMKNEKVAEYPDSSQIVSGIKIEANNIKDEILMDSNDTYGQPSEIMQYKNNKKTTKSPNFKAHVISLTEEEKPFGCSACDMTFNNACNIRGHMIAKHRHEKASFKCVKCSRKFSDPWFLSKHRKTCKIHTDTNTSPEGTIEHVNLEQMSGHKQKKSKKTKADTQGNIKPYGCTRCDMTFDQTSTLRQHVHFKHSDQLFDECVKCMVCCKNFDNPLLLSEHLCKHRQNTASAQSVGHPTFRCDICDVAFHNVKDLGGHRRSYKHRQHVIQKLNPKVKKSKAVSSSAAHLGGTAGIYKCDLCLKGFDSKTKLNKHHCTKLHKDKVSTRTAEQKITQRKEESFLSQYEAKPELHRCSECGKSFSKREHLAKHEYNHKIDPLKKCFICIKQLPTVTEFLEHLADVHIDLQVYECFRCGHKLDSFDSFSKHLQVTGMSDDMAALRDANMCKLPYRCDRCGVSFNTIAGLDSHRHQHISLPPPYKCTHCNQSFGKPYWLTDHVGSAHKEKSHLYQCNTCREVFNQSEAPLFTEHIFVCTDTKQQFSPSKSQESTMSNITHAKLVNSNASYTVNKKAHASTKLENMVLFGHRCDQCGKSLATQHELRCHKASHSKVDLKYTCGPDCPATFTKVYLLIQHQFRCHGKISFWCKLCNIYYTEQGTFSDHARFGVHTNIKEDNIY